MKNFASFLETLIREESKILPDQAPLEHFVHHNNLHHFENTPFEEAVEKIFYTYGKSPYPRLKYFREHYQKGEISKEIIAQKLKDNGFDIANDSLLEFIINDLYLNRDIKQIKFYKNEKMMFDLENKKWIPMDEASYLLWNEIYTTTSRKNFKTYPDMHANDSLGDVSLFLIPLLGILLDQGQAEAQLADDQRVNIWFTFKQYIEASTLKSNDILERYLPKNSDEVILRIQDLMSELSEEEIKLLVRLELQSIPGWAGMIAKMAKNKEVIPRRDVSLTLNDYLLMRLILNKVLSTSISKSHRHISYDVLIKENVFNYLRKAPQDKTNMHDILELFSQLDRITLRRIFLQAYEWSYQSKILKGIKSHKEQNPTTVKYQMFFCIDDRECSFRRYLEEVSHGEIETFGVAGFFGFDIMYKKLGHKFPRRYCPPAASPQYLIEEQGESKRSTFLKFIHLGQSCFLRSILSSFFLIPWKILDFKLHLYAPQTKRNISTKNKFKKEINHITFSNPDSDKKNSLFLGYSDEEKALRVANILKGAGLTKNFADYIYMIGHGHTSFNNPHVNAYRCGACSGANASPNAKLFALAANDKKIRIILSEKHHIIIPETTYFVGGYHDTCNDDVYLYNLSSENYPNEVEKKVQAYIDDARALNALERSQKFYQTPKKLNPEKALKFVQERTWRIAEARPELNHATNSLAIVGRRNLTKSLFLDRKAFLISYDPLSDSEGSILAGLLRAVIPVCGGINLEYYFSKVDTENYGSGSKTSHNVAGLFGVMNGIRGDLRTGLIWQMVEYHVPLRILFIIESKEEHLYQIMENNQEVSNYIKNHWIRLALINPVNKDDIKMYQNNQFEEVQLDQVKLEEYSSSDKVPTSYDKSIHIAAIKGVI